MLAHLLFRNSDGSFTVTGWYWVTLSTVVIVLSLVYMIFPDAVARKARLQSFPHAAAAVRVFALVTGSVATWFGLMAITAGPGQLV